MIEGLILSGAIDVGIACGVEAMSRVPLGANVMNGPGKSHDDDWDLDMPNQFEAAERIAKNRGITRDDIDELGVRSQAERRKQAWAEGRFDREVFAIEAPVFDAEGNVTGDPDRRPRRRPARDHEGGARQAQARPAGRHPHRRHVLADLRRRRGRALDEPRARPRPQGLRPRARVVARVNVGSDPYYHLDGPVDATAARC